MKSLLAVPAAEPAPAPVAVALVPLRALGVPGDVQRALQETLRNEIARLPEAQLVPEAKLAAALGRDLDCESSIACASDAASRAGARKLVVGTASALGDAFLLDLKLLDASSGQELARATHPVSGSRDALIETLYAASVELLAPARYVGALRIEVPDGAGAEIYVDGKSVGKAPLPAPVGGLLPGQHTVRVAGLRDTSTFVEVRFGKTAEVRVELGANAIPGTAGPGPGRSGPAEVLVTQPPARDRPPALRIAAFSTLGLSAVSAVTAIVFHARAYGTASDLNRREQQNTLTTTDLAAYGAIDRDVRRARGFYVVAGILAAAGGALLFWDLHLDGLSAGPGGISGRF